jgi:hypothetical protein
VSRYIDDVWNKTERIKSTTKQLTNHLHNFLVNPPTKPQHTQEYRGLGKKITLLHLEIVAT